MSTAGVTMVAVSLTLEMTGGAEAPRQARSAVLAALGDSLSESAATEVALVVSELVTNSVEHAASGPDERLAVDVDLRESCVHIEVQDEGARLRPRRSAPHPDAPSPLGLALVDRLAQAWGVERDGAGHTRVWCELPLSRA
jgi:two-component sensor histidine kinase